MNQSHFTLTFPLDTPANAKALRTLLLIGDFDGL